MQQLTIDCCIEADDGGVIGSQYLFGFGSEVAPAPWWLTAITGSYYNFTFMTREGAHDGRPLLRSFQFGDPSAGTGVRRISIQLDFTRNTNGSTDNSALCSIRAWINGAEQAVTRKSNTEHSKPQVHMVVNASTGTYTLTALNPATHTTSTSAPLDVPASSMSTARLQAVFDGLYGAGNTVVTNNNGLGTNYTVQFIGDLLHASIPQITVDASAAKGGSIQAFYGSSFTAGDNLHFASSEPGGIFCFYNGYSNVIDWGDNGFPSGAALTPSTGSGSPTESATKRHASPDRRGPAQRRLPLHRE